jgi:hypothetical protein
MSYQMNFIDKGKVEVRIDLKYIDEIDEIINRPNQDLESRFLAVQLKVFPIDKRDLFLLISNYFVHLHSHEVFRNPQRWLPWNYAAGVSALSA